ncbi:MAG: PhzF family phenazine biosynthesis protein [Caldimonas sp.]
MSEALGQYILATKAHHNSSGDGVTAPFAFSQVDVFTDVALRGNALAVVHGADPLSSERMQEFARWTHLSETSFLLAASDPGADYRVRIFTPGEELPFAGHPTLGSCHAWLEAGGRPLVAGQVTQQCGVGRVTIRLGDGEAAFAAPPLRSEPVDEAALADVLAALGLHRRDVQAARWLDNGPKWLGLVLASADAVLAVEPDHAALRTLAKVGLIGVHAPGSPFGFEVRAFAPSTGVDEDPVTGSLNAAFAGWLVEAGLAPPRYVAAQGQRRGRAGRVSIACEGGTVWVGGSSVTCIRGMVSL